MHNIYYVSSRIRRSRQGFSLVEVVLALGVISFSLVSLLGLLPVGLNSLRDALQINTQAQIIQSVASEIQISRFSDLDTADFLSTRFPKYFDDQGNELDDSQESTVLYTVTPLSPTYPTLPGNTANNPDLILFSFQIEVKNKPGILYPFTLTAANRGL